jgi:hypothetical protein
MIIPAFVLTFVLGCVLSLFALIARFRLARVQTATLPAQPPERMVLSGTEYPRWLRLLSFAGLFCLLASLSTALAPDAWRPSALIALAAVALVFALHVLLDWRSVARLELDDAGFELDEQRAKRRVKWIHLTELRNDGDVIRFRLNRALVRGAHWRYWDGAIRNRWGVDTRQLFRLLQRYRERAMETAPHYLTGRPEQSRS